MKTASLVSLWASAGTARIQSANGSCEYVGEAKNGNHVWKWTWDGTKQNNTAAKQPQKIIFSNNGAPQTADLGYDNGGYYNKDGLQGNVVSAIHSIITDDKTASVYTIDGRLVSTDGNVQQLPKGLYIVNKKKVIVK